MYKLTLIAAALAASQVAGAAEVYKTDDSAVNLYGRVYAGYNLGDEEGQSDKYGNNSYIRIGAKAKSAITDSMDAIARYEAQFGVDNTEKQDTVKTRLAYAGVKGDFGQVSFGRDYGSTYLIAGWTDVSFTDPYGNAAIGVNKDDNIGRTSGLLKYAGEFGGVEVQAGYKFNGEKDDAAGNSQDDSAAGIAAAYTLPFGLGFGAAYNTQKQGEGDDAVTTLVGVNYESDFGLWATLVYGAGENSPANGYYEHTGYEAVLGYKIMSDLKVQAMWNKAEGEKTDGAATTDITDYYLVGVRYDLNKNMRLVAEYQINNLDDFKSTGKAAENQLSFAARYDF